jgi:hypothetical protein
MNITPRAQCLVSVVRMILLILCLALLLQTVDADQTFVYAVQLSAAVFTAPPRITLSWQPDPFGVDTYSVYRKTQPATDWGAPVANLPGSALNYTDTNVSIGEAYEYQVVKTATLGYTGYGYIFAGINAPLIESRGTLLLVVATNSTGSLSNELARLYNDLLGDGWQVIRHDVSSNDTPETVRAFITSQYYADPANVNALFLFGHVPVLQSGYSAYDGHEPRPMPADNYYGDMLDDWPTDLDPTNRPSFIPSDVKLMIGRVDFANMPGIGAPSPWPTESELLRNYLNKDHNWRHKQLTVPRTALMANRKGDDEGNAEAATGYRNFEALVGPGTVVEANIGDEAPLEERWLSLVTSNSYLWSYACSSGQYTAMAWLGYRDSDNEVWSTDIVSMDAQAVFVIVFGSWFGNWDHQDNFMRSFLATPTMGLTACLAGRPHWYFHHMGLGEPIGYSARLTVNNSTLYRNQTNAFTRGVFVSLMGDPTLRLDPVAPIGQLEALVTSNSVHLNWTASADSVAGYHVYRAASPDGPFIRLTSSLLGTTAFQDQTALPPSPTLTYMVRAVKLQTTPSGTYYNPSQGIFVTVNAGSAIVCHAQLTAEGLLLTWNSKPGTTYRVLTATNLQNNYWIDSSGTVPAVGAVTSWTDPDISSNQRRFYRVVSP